MDEKYHRDFATVLNGGSVADMGSDAAVRAQYERQRREEREREIQRLTAPVAAPNFSSAAQEAPTVAYAPTRAAETSIPSRGEPLIVQVLAVVGAVIGGVLGAGSASWEFASTPAILGAVVGAIAGGLAGYVAHGLITAMRSFISGASRAIYALIRAPRTVQALVVLGAVAGAVAGGVAGEAGALAITVSVGTLAGGVAGCGLGVLVHAVGQGIQRLVAGLRRMSRARKALLGALGLTLFVIAFYFGQ
jgi:hypothetical protein